MSEKFQWTGWNTEFYWKGWSTTGKTLLLAGWNIIAKDGYKSKVQPWHDSRAKIYLRHPEHKMIGRITLERNLVGDLNNQVYGLDFMMQERNQRVKPPIMHLEPERLTEKDIPMLLEIIKDLQKDRQDEIRRKPNQMPDDMPTFLRLIQEAS